MIPLTEKAPVQLSKVAESAHLSPASLQDPNAYIIITMGRVNRFIDTLEGNLPQAQALLEWRKAVQDRQPPALPTRPATVRKGPEESGGFDMITLWAQRIRQTVRRNLIRWERDLREP